MAAKSTAFDDVRSLNLSAKEMLASFGRQVVEARKMDITDPAVKQQIQTLSDQIDRDVHEYNDKIQTVETMHAKWPPVPKRPVHYQKALEVGGKYFEVIDNMTSTIGGPSIDLTTLLNQHNINQTGAQQQSV